ncbi:MAG: hypothetical protein L3J28_08675 [Candidatus Polarisedimenticolaceae bacterium]|nr:hypothetical protein [Candidatus Polarisedimenticolaceae bacterium]
MVLFLRGGLLFVVSLLFLFLSACSAPHNKLDRPSWIDTPPANGLTASASASYEIFGESVARKNAILKGLSMIALQKANKVDIEGEVDQVSQFSSNNSVGSLRESASVSFKARIGGSEIPISAKIVAFWKDKIGKRVWVLMTEE